MPITHEKFAELITRNQKRIYGFIVSVIPSPVDADDIFQETCLTLWRKADSFEPSGEFVSWACGIAHNIIRNARVKSIRDRHIFSDATIRLIAEHRVARHEQVDRRQRALGHCLERVPSGQRELLELCYAGDATIDAISSQLGRKPNAVYQQLHRIRRALLECIEQHLQRGDLA